MPTERQGALAGSTGSRCRIFYQDGSKWNEIPGIGSFELAPSTRTSTTYTAFEGAFSTTGALEIGAATFEVASYLPNHRSWVYLDNQFNDNSPVQLRVETKANIVFNSGAGEFELTDANKATGLLTIAKSVTDQMNDVARGHQIVYGTAGSEKRVTIQAISDDDTPKFYIDPLDPTAAIGKTQFRVEMPILRWLITGKLSSNGGSSISEDAVNSSQFIVQPSGRVPLPSVQATHTMGIA